MEKRELISWIFGVIASVLALVGAWNAYHSQFEEKGASDAGVGAVFLFLKSQTQNIKNHYQDNVNEGVMVEESEAQLQRLKYEEQYIDNVQQALGVKE